MVYKVPPPWCLGPAAVITKIRSRIKKKISFLGVRRWGASLHKPLWAPFLPADKQMQAGALSGSPSSPLTVPSLQTQFSLQTILGILS